jgi:hypothetical protein
MKSIIDVRATIRSETHNEGASREHREIQNRCAPIPAKFNEIVEKIRHYRGC